MAQLRDAYPNFTERDAEILAIAPDAPATLARYWEDHDMPFPGLCDENHAVADLYGQEVKLLKLGRLPSVFIIDRGGNLRWERFSSSMTDIPPVGVLLDLLDRLAADH